MPHNHQHRAREIYFALLDLDTPRERAEFIERECGDDTALQSAVVNLLEVHEANASFLEKPLDGVRAGGNNGELAATIAQAAVAERPGTRIGPYKLLQQIGEGGFGVVYMAEQTKPVRRKVALKIIKPGMDTKEVIARFEAERQALALMDHPNIAKVLDAGTTSDDRDQESEISREDGRQSSLASDLRPLTSGTGRPYFVMELVHGIPITEFCDENKLTTRERLELFVDVCRAVQHAHQKGIIHRDLKPSNVLITMNDDRPMPKVIDFGISKALSQQLTEKTLFTAFGQMVGTPLYMSPEQAQFTANDVDTRSDVYSLGVLLYELLTGSTPFDKEMLQKSGFDEMRRLIREVDPPRPSARVSTLHAEALSTASDKRRVDPRKLGDSLRGELDWIVMKALEKDRNRRYESASALAADVERYLADEAVSARPQSVWYRFRKSARRHKAGLTTAVLVALALIAGTAASTWEAFRATRAEADALAGWHAEADRRRETEQQRRKAEQQRKRAVAARKCAEAVEGFLISAFHRADPAQDGRKLKVADVLKLAAKKVDRKIRDPRTKARLLNALGSTYRGLGLYREAVPLFKRARTLLERSLGPTHQETLASMNNLSAAYASAGRYEDAISLHEQTLKLMRENLGWKHPESLKSMNNLAAAYTSAGRYEDAISLHEQTLKLMREKLGWKHPDTLASMTNLAAAYLSASRYEDAIRLQGKTLKLVREKLGISHPLTLSSMNSLADAYSQAGRYQEAILLHKETLKLTREKLGNDHPGTLRSMNNLAAAYLSTGRYEEAIRLLKETLKLCREKLGNDHPGTLFAMNNLAAAYMFAGRYEEAIHLLQETLKLRRETLGGDHPETLNTMSNLAAAFDSAGRYDEAVRLHKEALNLARARFGTDSSEVGRSLALLAETLLKERRYAEAEPLLRECLKIREKKIPQRWLTFNARSMLGGSLAGQGKLAEAEPLLLSGYNGMKQREARISAPSRFHLTDAARRLVDLYERKNEPQKAAAWRRKLPVRAAKPRNRSLETVKRPAVARRPR